MSMVKPVLGATPGTPDAAGASKARGPARVGLTATYLASATTPWNGWLLGGSIRPGDVFLFVALFAFFASGVRHGVPRIAGWAVQFAAIIAVITAVHELLPVDSQYMYQRDVLVQGQIIHGLILTSNFIVGLKFLAPIVGLPLMYALAFRHDPRAPYRAFYAFTIGTVISAFIAFSDRLGVTQLSYSITGIPVASGRAPGLTIQYNFLAMTCILCLPLILWELLSKQPRHRLWAWVFLLITLAGLYASGSRAGAAVFAGGALLSIVIMPPYRKVLPTVSLILAGMLGILFVLKPSVGTALLKAVRLTSGNSSAAASDQARSIVNDQGTRDWQHRPLDGIGFQVAGEAHNVYLQALATGGIILLIGYAIFMLGALAHSLRLSRHANLAYPLFVSAVSIAVFNSAQNALTERVTYATIAIIAAIPLGQRAPMPGDPDYA